MNHIISLINIINPMNWSLQKVLVVGGVIWISLILITVEPIARVTVLKKFYQNVALAAKYSDELAFDHFITRTSSSEGTRGGNARRNGYRFNNCSSAGTYWNNVTGRTIHGAFTCSRNFISYYGIDNFNVQAIDNAKKEMISLGWVEVGEESTSEDSFNSFKEQNDGTIRGFSLHRGNNINASMIFLSQGSEDYQAYCRNLSDECRALEKVDAAHSTIMAVNISAYKGYED